MQYRNRFYILIYLTSIILANLIVSMLGPSSVIWVAFLFIGLDLTSRDYLHEAWHNEGLWWKMAVLVGTGSLFTYLLNTSAGPVAIASFVAFALAGIADTVTYHLLKDRARMVKINGSNVVSALVDSVVFPTMAFGAFMPLIILGQFAAKVGGGFVWSLILNRRK